MRDVFKIVAFAAFSLVSLLMLIITARTLSVTTREIEAEECKPIDTDFIKADSQLLSRFQEAIRIPTISRNPGDYNIKELLDIQRHIKSCK